MANSFKITSIDILNKVIEEYKDIQIDFDDNKYIFVGKNNDFTVTIYRNYTVFFQGINAQEELHKWINPEPIVFEHMGSDEVGCGDYFGPIVVCACYIQEKDYEELNKLGVKDSKQLTDKQIKEIAPTLIKKIPHASFILSNTKYNEIRKENYNLNKVKAYLHNFVLNKLAKKYNFSGKIVIDQFCPEDTYYKYLEDYNEEILHGITFETKAENKYLAVACGSIIARYLFLNEMEKLSLKINRTIPLGANTTVDEFAFELAKEIGMDKMNEFVKLHFKNTNTLLDKIKNST